MASSDLTPGGAGVASASPSTKYNNDGPLPPIRRLITSHDATTGKAVFSSRYPETVEQSSMPGHHFSNCYTLQQQQQQQQQPSSSSSSLGVAAAAAEPQQQDQQQHQPSLTDEADLDAYAAHYPAMDSLHLDRGTVVRVVDFHAGIPPLMHRTQSVDVGVVLHGVLTCVLDSGEERTLHPGDMIVQRGTMHAWRNDGPGFARAVFVLQGVAPVEVAGQALDNHVPWEGMTPEQLAESIAAAEKASEAGRDATA